MICPTGGVCDMHCKQGVPHRYNPLLCNIKCLVGIGSDGVPFYGGPCIECTDDKRWERGEKR